MQLKAVAFKNGEVPQVRDGLIEVQEPVPEGTRRSFAPASVPACQTVRDVLNARDSHAHIFQIFNWKDDIWGGGSTLASYEDGRAQQRFVDLRQSLSSCRTYDGEAWSGKFTATVAPAPAPSFGDEAVSYTETIPLGAEKGGDRNETFVVVRTGNTIASFSALNVGGTASFPADLITKQIERLRAAQQTGAPQ
ncbi:hypothetical protein AW27_017065 [Streptomyces sp. PCS3-D2]|uniref:hypothetical protein n=1 Tax=Streptomyces sp. PCS3-D2 TaxID=1460244 RepID=UPI000B0D153B|nr:hypothetical protein [Streptomyces sp. PCS3-D2]WKV73099.1 hypothetical protein AW27_017065 [Streptomyces sp. PCS3-D2]